MTCCGRGRKEKPRPLVAPAALPPNPKIPRGRSLVYVGGRIRHVRGKATGLVYHVGPGARFVRVHSDDLEQFLDDREFVSR